MGGTGCLKARGGVALKYTISIHHSTSTVATVRAPHRWPRRGDDRFARRSSDGSAHTVRPSPDGAGKVGVGMDSGLVKDRA